MATSVNASARAERSRQAATILLDQQLWCWGQDIKHPSGNLLERHGFERVEPPEGHGCSSLYRLRLSMGSRVILRGFGVFYGEDGAAGVFVGRHHFDPRFTPCADLVMPPWWPGDLPTLRSPKDGEVRAWLHLSGTLLRWIRVYESWIVRSMGPSYRAATLERWRARGRAVVPADRIQDYWASVECLLIESLGTFQGARSSIDPIEEPTSSL